MDWSGREIVEVVPGKVSGRPVIRGSRAPADHVIENHNAGESIEDIAYNFDLESGNIRTVLAYAAGHSPAFGP
jgi:uncharacterized protein (DUF433 family)